MDYKLKIKKSNNLKYIAIISLLFTGMCGLILCFSTLFGKMSLDANPILIVLFIVLILSFGISIFSIFRYLRLTKEIENEIKLKSKEAIERLIPNSSCFPDNCINPQALYELGVLPYYDRADGNFLININSDNNEYTFSNINLVLKMDEENPNLTEEIFKGQIYVFNYKTEINGHIRILSSHRNDFFKFEYLDNLKERNFPELKIETENEDFNNNFEVYGTDEHFAFYLLNSKVIEELLKMKKKYFYNICIFEDKIVLTTNTKKTFFKNDLQTIAYTEEDLRNDIKELLNTINKFEEILNNKREP